MKSCFPIWYSKAGRLRRLHLLQALRFKVHVVHTHTHTDTDTAPIYTARYLPRRIKEKTHCATEAVCSLRLRGTSFGANSIFMVGRERESRRTYHCDRQPTTGTDTQEGLSKVGPKSTTHLITIIFAKKKKL